MFSSDMMDAVYEQLITRSKDRVSPQAAEMAAELIAKELKLNRLGVETAMQGRLDMKASQQDFMRMLSTYVATNGVITAYLDVVAVLVMTRIAEIENEPAQQTESRSTELAGLFKGVIGTYLQKFARTKYSGEQN